MAEETTVLKGAQLLELIKSVSNERGLPEEIVLQAFEEGLAEAHMGMIEMEDEPLTIERRELLDLSCIIDRETGEFQPYRHWTVLPEDEEVEFPYRQLSPEGAREMFGKKKPDKDGRYTEKIPAERDLRKVADACKKALRRRLMEEERKRNADTYRDRVGRMLTGSVKRVLTRNDRDRILVELAGGAEAVLPRRNLIEGDRFVPGDQVRAVLEEIEETPRGPTLIMSRTAPELVTELLAREVPEVSEQVVEIKKVAREAGGCTKIAVKSNDARIDPVGACVGMRGLRINEVMSQLNGERVDVILWNDDTAQLALAALGPVRPLQVRAFEGERKLNVVIDQEQLARAIGRNGQNVRLASKLSEWAIVILDPEQARELELEEEQKEQSVLERALGIDADTFGKLRAAGLDNIDALVNAEAAQIAEALGGTEEEAESLQVLAAEKMFDEAVLQSHEDPTPDQDVLELQGMDANFAFELAREAGVTSMQGLADLAVDDVLEHLPQADEDKVGDWIMAARQVMAERAEKAEAEAAAAAAGEASA